MKTGLVWYDEDYQRLDAYRQQEQHDLKYTREPDIQIGKTTSIQEHEK